MRSQPSPHLRLRRCARTLLLVRFGSWFCPPSGKKTIIKVGAAAWCPATRACLLLSPRIVGGSRVALAGADRWIARPASIPTSTKVFCRTPGRTTNRISSVCFRPPAGPGTTFLQGGRRSPLRKWPPDWPELCFALLCLLCSALLCCALPRLGLLWRPVHRDFGTATEGFDRGGHN